MCHDELRNLLAEYAFGESTELTPDEKARIEAHLAGCSDCQKELQSTKHLYNQLRPPKVIKVPQEILDSTPANVMAAIHRRMVSRRLLRVACFIPAIGVCLRCLPAVPGACGAGACGAWHRT
jgi:anti-sigma factor RsiW